MNTQGKQTNSANKQQAMTALQSGKLEEARGLLDALCAQDGKDPEAWLMLGATYGQMGGNMEEVVRCSKQALMLDPGNPGALSNLGNALSSLGRYAEAADSYRKALALQANDPAILNNLGNAVHLAGNPEEAEKHFREAIRLRPNYVDAYYNLAQLLQEQGEADEAVTNYMEALRRVPSHAGAFSGLARTLRFQHRLDDALAFCGAILQAQPNNLVALTTEAKIFEWKGEADKAYERIRRLLDAGQEDSRVVDIFTRVCHKYNRCDDAIAMGQRLLANSATLDDARQAIHFSLGKLCDRMESYDDAFEHLQQGNLLACHQFDKKEHTQMVDYLVNRFSAQAMVDLPRSSVGSERPVFIIGMPRSGTSLTEQILASHPLVFGAGELNDINRLATNVNAALDTDCLHPAYIPGVTKQLNLAARKYLDRLNSLSSDALRITDKMPSNFMYLGLIALLFPGARIIHCTRDPLDNCLSIYAQKFNRSHSYASDLGNLGFYYREYQRLMQHWSKVMDIPILEVSYEQLVADQETTSREMVKFCGLEWDESCLEFHKSERQVITASYNQVRNPIYTKSVGRWKHYARHLEPLMRSLDL